MQCLFFISHGLHPCNAYSLLITAYTYVFLVSGNHFVDFIYGRMYNNIRQVHRRSRLYIKVAFLLHFVCLVAAIALSFIFFLFYHIFLNILLVLGLDNQKLNSQFIQFFVCTIYILGLIRF